MTCIQCRSRVAADPDGTLCEACRVDELRRLIENQRQRTRAEFRSLPPSLCFLLSVMVETGWPERAVTGAQHALARPEKAIPAVFAHVVETDGEQQVSPPGV